MSGFKLDHMHILSPNVEATATWFERIFGAEVIRTMQQGKPRVDLKLSGTNIFIAPLPPDAKPNPANPYQGLDHFGLTVDNLDKTVAELKAKGVTFTTEPHEVRPGTRIAFLRTPDGVRIELLQRS
jgi:catechol 2,3-dioxygenase-like lactoylglutathione lyase family enzyme